MDDFKNQETGEECADALRVRALHKELLKMISELREDPRTPEAFTGILGESQQEIVDQQIED